MKEIWRSFCHISKPLAGQVWAVKQFGGKVKSSAKKFERPMVQGWLHTPANMPHASMALFHGAGGNCQAPLLVAVAEAFCASGYVVFRGDLPFRQQRPKGSPSGNSQRDRDGIRRAAEELS